MNQSSRAKGLAVLVVVGLGALLFAAAWLTSRAAITPPAAAPAPLPALSTPSPLPTEASSAPDGSVLNVGVVGDSLAEGAGTDGGAGWPERLASEMCWSIVSKSAEGGTGYARVEEGASPGAVVFRGRVAEIVKAKPQVVLVEGGVNDVEATPQQVVDGAVATFKELREGLGDGVPIVAIGPLPGPRHDAEGVARVSTAISYAASGFGIGFVDPMRGQWLPDPSYWSEDGYHPTESGYAEYTKRLGAELRKLGAKTCAS